jgi:uncharacterized protein
MSQDFYQKGPIAAAAPAVDAGLQAYMRSVFNIMTVGLGVTGAVAWGVANVEPLFNLIFKTPLYLVAIFAPMVFVMAGFRQSRVARLNAGQLRNTFLIFSALMGVSFAAIIFAFSGASIARAFFITAGTFAGMSLYGYTTKRDLTAMASFLMMGLMGIVIASIANVFIASSALHFAVSAIGVFVFTGLTAFEVQRLKETYAWGSSHEEANAKLAVLGALNLYMNFINLFQTILHFTGSSRE